MLGVSMLIIGSGYASIPVIRRIFVEKKQFLSEVEYADMLAIATSSPGAVGVGLAALVGKKVGGNTGVFLSVLGMILPPLVLITIIQLCYDTFIANSWVRAIFLGMNAAVAAVMFSVVLDMMIALKRSFISYFIAAAVFGLTFFLKIPTPYLIIGAVLLGVIIFLVKRRKKAC